MLSGNAMPKPLSRSANLGRTPVAWKISLDFATCTDAGLGKGKDLLHSHYIALHASDLLDAGDLAFAIREPECLHDYRYGRRNLLACGLMRQIEACHADHVL